jgi:tetratricopeptide (TPR) repeat protein
MNDEGAKARDSYRRSRAILRDVGQSVLVAASGIDVALVELMLGDPAAAEAEVQADYDFLSGLGETYYCSTLAALLSRIVRDQGRLDDALQLSIAAERATSPDDRVSQVLWRSARASILAHRGDLIEAEALASGAVELVDSAESPSAKADALVEFAAVLKIAGKLDEARAAMNEALRLYDLKENKIGAARGQRWIAENLPAPH